MSVISASVSTMNIRTIAKTQHAAGTRFTWHPIYHASRRGRGSNVNIYANANITIYRYVNIQKGEDERGRRSDGTREEGKGSGERLARAREIGV